MAQSFSSTARGVSPGARALLEGDKQAIGDERDEDVGLDAMIALVVDGPDRQIALELLEGLLDLGELDVIAPELRWVGVAEVGAQQIAALAPPRRSQLVLVQGVTEGGGADRLVVAGQPDVDQGVDVAGLLLGGAELEQQLIAAEPLVGDYR